MNLMTYLTYGSIFLAVVLVIGGIIVSFYKQVPQGRAFIIKRPGQKTPNVTFNSAIIIPGIHMIEKMDISVVNVDVERNGKNGLICKDDIRADIIVNFFVGVNDTTEDVLRVSKNIGCQNTTNKDYLKHEILGPKFSEALKTAGKEFDFEELLTERIRFRDKIIEIIGKDLEGYKLKDVAIDYLEQTSVDLLDDNNILDARGKKKIIEITAEHNIQTAAIEEDEKTRKKEKEVTSKEARLALERQEEEATERKNREVAEIKAKEKAASDQAQIQAAQETELAELKKREKLETEALNVQRELEKAEVNKNRDIQLAQEESKRQVAKEAVETERSEETLRMQKEIELESQRLEQADKKSQTVKVERQIATEEEATFDLRVKSEAEREKVKVLKIAEAKAEASQVEKTTAAKADQQVAETEVQIAQSKRTSVEEEAKGKTAMAQAVQRELAAKGLADAEVLMAQAEVDERQGLAQAKVKEEMGKAEASAIRENLEAMASADKESRDFEQNRYMLDKLSVLMSEQIVTEGDVAKANATVIAEAMNNADIQLFGESGDFMNTIRNATLQGKAMDASMESSKVMKALSDDVIRGKGDKVNSMFSSFAQGNPNMMMSMMLAQMMNQGGLNGTPLVTEQTNKSA